LQQSPAELIDGSAMLIDSALPRYDVSEKHAVEVRAPVDEVYAAVRRCDLGRAKIAMLLMRLRGLPAGLPVPSRLTLDDFLRAGFILLGERPNRELLLGLVGRFWTMSGELRRLEAAGFRDFDEPGFAKAAWNFSLTGRPDKTVLLETETRVYCPDAASRRRFRLYWLFVGPFSGLIRREALRAIRRNAEEVYGREA
jgi:hypothetical protein